MIWWSFGVGGAVNKQHRPRHLPRGLCRAHIVNSKAALLFRKLEGPPDNSGGKGKWRALDRHGAKVGEGLGCDYRGDPRICRGLLKRYGCAERSAKEDNRTRTNRVHDVMEILLLVEPVGAGLAC